MPTYRVPKLGDDGKVPERLLPAFVAGDVLDSNGNRVTTKKLTVKLTPDGLDIDDLIIEDI